MYCHGQLNMLPVYVCGLHLLSSQELYTPRISHNSLLSAVLNRVRKTTMTSKTKTQKTTTMQTQVGTAQRGRTLSGTKILEYETWGKKRWECERVLVTRTASIVVQGKNLKQKERGLLSDHILAAGGRSAFSVSSSWSKNQVWNTTDLLADY